jgi:hypothetical protein
MFLCSILREKEILTGDVTSLGAALGILNSAGPDSWCIHMSGSDDLDNWGIEFRNIDYLPARAR